MALELRYAPGEKDSYTIPPSVDIVYKGKTYSIPIRIGERAAHDKSALHLVQGTQELGGCLFHAETPLMIDSLTSYNMVNETGMRYIKFANSSTMRTTERIPVGTILIETLKQIAALNGNRPIELVSMNDAKEFYKRKGFVLRDGSEKNVYFRYQRAAEAASSSASSSAVAASSSSSAGKPRRRRNRKTRRRRN